MVDYKFKRMMDQKNKIRVCFLSPASKSVVVCWMEEADSRRGRILGLWPESVTSRKTIPCAERVIVFAARGQPLLLPGHLWTTEIGRLSPAPVDTPAGSA